MSFPLALLGGVLAVVRAAALLASALGVAAAVLFALLWLWRRTANLPPFVWAGLAVAIGAYVLHVLLLVVGNSLRALRHRLDPRAAARARVLERARDQYARYEHAVYRSLLRVPAAPQHPGDP